MLKIPQNNNNMRVAMNHVLIERKMGDREIEKERETREREREKRERERDKGGEE